MERYKLTGHKVLDMKPGHLKSGNNSGYAAINLAIHMGAKVVILLGFDMKFDAAGSHWHEGHKIANRERQFSKMLPFFDTLPVELKRVGVSVINACEDSRIDVFPKIRLECAA